MKVPLYPDLVQKTQRETVTYNESMLCSLFYLMFHVFLNCEYVFTPDVLADGVRFEIVIQWDVSKQNFL